MESSAPSAPDRGAPSGWHRRLLGVALLGALAGTSAAAGPAAAPTRIESIRVWPAPEQTRVVFDISGPVEHTVFRLDRPERLVIDLIATTLGDVGDVVDEGDRQLEGLRAAVRNRSDLRVVLDLKRQVTARSFLLKPNHKYGHRLVIDLEAASARRARDSAPRAIATTTVPVRLRDVVVAIDAGHGGEDPGALGQRGHREKDLVFQIAKRLEQELRAIRGLRPVLVRTGDYYVGLRKRMALAREERADLFVSIHADAFRDPRVRGSSVYVLSRNGASSEAAKWLADQENAADLIGGVSLDDKDTLLASVLLDLSQTATLSASADAGAKVLDELVELGKVHKRQVQRAGFMVLKSPDIPSILIETGFITSPTEELRLADPEQQRLLAKRIAVGLQGYFERNAPEGTLLAARRHVISSGETLSHIATRYRVPLAVLRAENGLAGDNLRIGQVLRIPNGSHGS